MNKKSPNFFKRLKDAIFNFDEYKTFAEEKISIAIIYSLILMVIFSVIIILSLTYKFAIWKNEGNNQFVAGYNQELGIIINYDAENMDNIPEANDYQMVIGILNNNIVVKSNYLQLENVTTYDTLQSGYMICIILFTTYFIEQIIIDILLLTLLGFLLSKILGLRLKYKSIFNISAYSLTLSIILYLTYIVVNLFTGFNIVYFYIAYRLIAYIYIITALLIIKSDLIKQNMELTKIVEVQKQVKEEKEQEEEKKENEKDKKKEEKKEDKEKDKKENNNSEEPEGNQA